MILFYFHTGVNYTDFLKGLAARHGVVAVVLSKRHLIRLLKRYNLNQKQYANLSNVVVHQLDGPGRLHGYRWMYNKCMKNGIRAKKEDVHLIKL